MAISKGISEEAVEVIELKRQLNNVKRYQLNDSQWPYAHLQINLTISEPRTKMDRHYQWKNPATAGEQYGLKSLSLFKIGHLTTREVFFNFQLKQRELILFSFQNYEPERHYFEPLDG
jgi:hypothetical protein